MPAPRFHILPTSGVPIYRQVVDQVRAAVAGGRLAPGDLLPSVRQVAGELQVNPMTISKAYALLQQEGVVEMVRGRGVRVIEPQTVGTRRQRREALEPLLRQVATAVFQLGLSAEEVVDMLDGLLEESERERAGDAASGRG